MLHIILATLLLVAGGSAVQAADRPVVVELFTSEGCSSCPPADAFLTELSRTRADVLPLAFHVTYWDRLGWKDPYGLQAATERQARYGVRFGDGSYTPEMVIDGRKGLVGSDRSEAEAVIVAAAAAPSTSPSLVLGQTGRSLSIRVGEGHGTARIVLVGYDSQHRTAVGRGENSGRSLTESNIVRSIRTVGAWTGVPVTLSVDPAAGERTAVLLEAPDGTIVGASRLEPSS